MTQPDRKPDAETPGTSSGLGAVDKALQVLLHLHREREDCGVTAIGRALGLPKSTTHRLLAALSRRGFVERDGRGRYRPGVALISRGLGALEQEPVAALAAPVLRHRIVTNFAAESDGVPPDTVIEKLIAETPSKEGELTSDPRLQKIFAA